MSSPKKLWVPPEVSDASGDPAGKRFISAVRYYFSRCVSEGPLPLKGQSFTHDQHGYYVFCGLPLIEKLSEFYLDGVIIGDGEQWGLIAISHTATGKIQFTLCERRLGEIPSLDLSENSKQTKVRRGVSHGA